MSPLFPLLLLFSICHLLPYPSAVLVSGVSLDSANCDGNCIHEMERLIDATPATSLGGLLRSSSAEQNSLNQQFFGRICESFQGVDKCLARCESRNKQAAELKAAYAGLQFVCKERREEFFGSLPCLFENESKGIRKCASQMNQSHETTQLFTNSITSREFHSMQMRFSAFCRDLSAVIRCMVPLIQDYCGERPASLLLRFIGLEFSSFESLYRHLGFDSPMPVSCRSLIKYAMANSDQHQQKSHNQQHQKPFGRSSAKFYKLYLNGSNGRPNHFWFGPIFAFVIAFFISL